LVQADPAVLLAALPGLAPADRVGLPVAVRADLLVRLQADRADLPVADLAAVRVDQVVPDRTEHGARRRCRDLAA
jgi:hypothetical protein